jgi:RHS repeat-associated protein
VVTYKYVQVSNTDSGYYTIRDAALVQIVYGTSSTTAGTVDLFYKGPSNQSVNSTQYVTAYGNNEGGCTPPDGNTSTKRCDDPEDKSGGLPNAWVMSVLSLSTIKTYVGDDSSNSHLDYSYALSYSDTPYTNCKDPQSGTAEYCAGNHLLTSITPTVYQNSTSHALPGVTFTYSDPNQETRTNYYEDTSQTVPAGGDYKVQTKWRYLKSYHDHSNGVGATIVWHTAYNNSSGTPFVQNADGSTDNRYDPFYCVWNSSDCSSSSKFYPFYNKMWTEQVVYQITQIGTDSSASSLSPGTTTYHYWLTKTTGSCTADSQGDSDCVGYGWIPDSTDGWQDFYHGDFRGFGTVLITSSSGDLTVQKYYATEGWDSSEGDAGNYLAGNMYEEDVYQGNAINTAKQLKQTFITYAGTNSTATSCSSAYSAGLYKPCEVIPLSSKTTIYEQTGSAGPWVQTSATWDDYASSSGLVSGKYHNKTSEVTTGSNIPTKTQNWTYQTTDTTVNGTVYYNVHSATHSELVDSSGHKWLCSDATYDEGRSSGLPSPAAGWPTTEKTYSNCTDSSTSLTTYTGYDANGDAVAIVDGVGAANPSLYNNNGCALSTAPVYLSSNWTAGHYTSCTAYSSANAQPTDTWNALGQHIQAVYDSTQGLLLTSVKDVNSLTTSEAYSYDSSGNATTQVKDADESGSYTKQGTQKSTCTDSSTLPCMEEDGNTLLYSSAVTRTFYDGLGRKVETLTPGPDSTHTTVSFMVYNDTAHTIFTSVPFVVASRSTWLDPNGATDYNGVTPGGTSVTLDPLGRTLTSTDPLSHVTTTSYGYGTSGVSGDSNTYAITTVVDANNHESTSYANTLGRIVYKVDYSGLSTGTLTAVKRTMTQYNVLDKPTSVVVTDLTPQSGQSVTSVTTTATYDDLGRQLTLVDPDRGSHTYSYDAEDHLLTDVSGSRTLGSSYDLLGRLGCLQDTVPTLDVHGACTSGAHPFVQNTYDADPSGVSWSGTNYAVGHLTQSVTSTYYPAPDSVTGTVTENYQYDQRSRTITKRLTMAVTGGSTIIFPTFPTYQATLAYNDADQLTTTQTSVGGTTGYTFTQAYDSTTGLQIGLSNGSTASTNLAALSYNANGLINTITLKDSSGANLASESLLYDGVLRPASATTTWSSGGSTVYSDAVSYDNVGNVLSRSTTQATVSGVSGSGGNEVQNFCYDEQNRLVWASNATTATAASGQTCGSAALQATLGGSYTHSYVYTNLGQLWQGPLSGGGTQEQYLYCSNGHPHQVTALSPTSGSPTCSATGTTGYSATYDAWGNVSSRSTGTTTGSTLSFDALDHLVRWNGSTASAANGEWYLYDADGNRVMRRSASTASGGNPATSSATITVYAFGLEEHTYSYTGSGSTLTNTGNTYYYTLAGRLIGKLSGTSTLTTSFLLTDLLGSVVSTISNTVGSAQLLWNQQYGPYGEKRYSAGTVDTSKGFTGQYGDDLTGLDYYVARYYDPVIGRFLSADTKQGNVQGADPYAYVSGNPETMTDPTGQMIYNPGTGQVAVPQSDGSLRISGWNTGYSGTFDNTVTYVHPNHPANSGGKSSSSHGGYAAVITTTSRQKTNTQTCDTNCHAARAKASLQKANAKARARNALLIDAANIGLDIAQLFAEAAITGALGAISAVLNVVGNILPHALHLMADIYTFQGNAVPNWLVTAMTIMDQVGVAVNLINAGIGVLSLGLTDVAEAGIKALRAPVSFIVTSISQAVANTAADENDEGRLLSDQDIANMTPQQLIQNCQQAHLQSC